MYPTYLVPSLVQDTLEHQRHFRITSCSHSGKRIVVEVFPLDDMSGFVCFFGGSKILRRELKDTISIYTKKMFSLEDAPLDFVNPVKKQNKVINKKKR